MRKILASLLTLVFCSFISNSYADNIKKVEEIDIEKYHHFDIGISGFSLQVRYAYDLTSYNELGLKASIGAVSSINDDYNNGYNHRAFGGDISLEDKAYFFKSRKLYSKNNSVITNGWYIKTFASLTRNTISIDPDFGKYDPDFLAVGTGVGFDFLENNMGLGIGLDLGTTLQMKNNNLGGNVFFRPELNFKIAF